MIEDAMIEMNCYQQHLDKLPVLTRDEFEEKEYQYWKNRLEDDAKKELLQYGTVTVATAKQLESMGVKIGKNENKQLVFVYDDKMQIVTDNENKKKLPK